MLERAADVVDASALATLATLCVALWLVRQRRASASAASSASAATPDFRRFQRRYLLVALAVMASDWCQGSHVYALYESKGLDPRSIGQLFVAGYASSAVFGTFVGAMADRFGRRANCLLFCVLYALSSAVKLSSSFPVMLLSRVLSGVGTSILFSAFESWMVTEHAKRGFAPELVADTFARFTFGNGLVAVFAGLASEFVSRRWGFVAPFMLSMGIVCVSAVLILTLMTENYGQASGAALAGLRSGVQAMWREPHIAVLGASQSLFEAGMYVFVFVWTPTVRTVATGVPSYGVIFACYMLALMAGSSLFALPAAWRVSGARIGGRAGPVLEHWYSLLLALGAASLLGATSVREWLATSALGAVHAEVPYAAMLSCFFVFEAACGFHFPAIGTLRSVYVPDHCRASVMTLFRVPLNALVVCAMLSIDTLGPTLMLRLSASAVLVSACALLVVKSVAGASRAAKRRD